MAQHNSTFELTIEDVDLIESALNLSKQDLSSQMLDGTLQLSEISGTKESQDETLRQIHDLLGRLHNQKVFFRPRSGSYIGG